MFDRFSSRAKRKDSQSVSTPAPYKKTQQKVVVRMNSGDVHRGVTFSLNRQAPGFHLELLANDGSSLSKTMQVAFKDVKAVFYVKSFDGRFDPNEEFSQDQPEGDAIAVEFTDGEVIVGRPVNSRWNDEERFLLIPEDQSGNNLLILVERSAVSSIRDATLYAREQESAYQKYKATHLRSDMTEEECQGDYLFRSGKYGDAFKLYRELFRNDPENARLKKKLCASRYNLAVRFIRQKNYVKALQFMEAVLATDPEHTEAAQRVEQLRAHLLKKQSKSSTR
jgi:hypothetical protein